jgi:hypothetical protein
MYLDEAFLLGVLTKEALGKRELYCAILKETPAERGMSIRDVEQVDWPGYPQGGIPVSTERCGEVYTASDTTAEALVIFDACRFTNDSEVNWKADSITAVYYFHDSETQKLFWHSQMDKPVWVAPGQTLHIPPLIVT